MKHIGKRRARTGRHLLATVAVALSIGGTGLAAVVGAGAPAAGADTAQTSATNVASSTTFNAQQLTASGSGVTATTDLFTKLVWTQPALLGTSFDPTQVRQGDTVTPTDSYTRPAGPGTLSVAWTLGNSSVSWNGITVPLGSPTFTASGPCALLAGGPNYSCDLTSAQDTIFDTYPLPNPYVKLAMGGHVIITPQGLATLRSTSFGGSPGPSTGLTLGESPITDSVFIPCTIGAGTDLNYSLGSVSARDGVTLDTSFIFEVGAEFPAPPFGFPEVDVPFASPTFQIDSENGTLPMNGPGASFDLGQVQKNNVPPVVNAGGPYVGNEGSPIIFDGTGSSSICGAPTLRWDFSDGGVAFGPTPEHTFEGPGVYSGLLTATDATGLSSTTTFSVTVNDLPPVPNAGPNMTTEWGFPVTLSGSAVDPGTDQQPFLTYSWDFGDGTGGQGGAVATHTYANPGLYVATFTACDPEVLCASSTTTVTVTQQGTELSYTGATSSQVTVPSNLTATLLDDHGRPVVGRVVEFFVQGSLVPFATATTPTSGTVSIAYPFPLGSVGTHTIVAKFEGDTFYSESQDLIGYTVTKADTTLKAAHTSVTWSWLLFRSLTMTATLTTSATGAPVVGQTVTLTPGSATGPACTATTDASGVASCTSSIGLLSPNPEDYSATFGGSADYQPSSAIGDV